MDKKTLVIVESPTKVKTITKYLGKDYIISSSRGHIIDLPKSRMAVDVDHNFEPEYITIRGKAKVLNELKKFAKKADTVLLATDPDREGEAISWHLANSLAKFCPNIKRIEFNEITRNAVLDAVKNPRELNMSLVNAQQARRILDRIVGYSISPILWKKVKKGLSAGRVQSVALKVICEREEQIDAFNPEEYWTYDIAFKIKGREYSASLYAFNNEKISISTREEIDDITSILENSTFVIESLKSKKRTRKPIAPFITSKLQQDAANRLGFTTSKTMMVAQQLYEGIDLGGEDGQVGLITYMRTDSTRISQGAIESVRKYISENYSDEYLPEEPNSYSNKKGSQDAHEAIRPTEVFRTPESIKKMLSGEQYKLYNLIWKRFVSSQMTPERSEIYTLVINGSGYLFRSSATTVLFDGFAVLDKEGKAKKAVFPKVDEGDEVNVSGHMPEQHFTSPPPRYNDASLVKFLEESGIGRPSTYAPTINTLIKRYYVNRSGRQLVPTVLGKLVNTLVKDNFANLVSIEFTSGMEEKLDSIELEKTEWHQMLRDFYDPFIQGVHDAEENIDNLKGVLDEETDLVCELCGAPMLKKLGKFGYFLACSAFPDCRNAKSLPLGRCPQCEGDVVKRSSKKGRPFYACSEYPECEFVTRDLPADKDCPKCGKLLFKKRIRGKGERLVCLNEECGYFMDLLDEVEEASKKEDYSV
ncbi:MAG: type I DNA topoisomerase [Spirochaetes bacterium]|nr:type I DNA topoisomerase [Spirochaetota bacterium]MBN2771580.1 type I DNA topoisomerase [Spirochaetota bacterium]